MVLKGCESVFRLFSRVFRRFLEGISKVFKVFKGSFAGSLKGVLKGGFQGLLEGLEGFQRVLKCFYKVSKRVFEVFLEGFRGCNGLRGVSGTKP